MKKALYILLTASVTLFLIFIIVYATKWRNENPVLSIVIEGNYSVKDSEILNYAHLKADSIKTLEEIDLKQIEDRILRNKEIKKVSIQKILPTTLKINIIEKSPVAVVNTNEGIKLIGEDMELIPITEDIKMYDLPVINGITRGNNVVIEDMKKGVYVVASILRKSKYLHTIISEINLSDTNNILVFTTETKAPFLFPKYREKTIEDKEFQKDTNYRILVLKTFFENIFNDERENDMKYIDLQYKSQLVIKYN